MRSTGTVTAGPKSVANPVVLAPRLSRTDIVHRTRSPTRANEVAADTPAHDNTEFRLGTPTTGSVTDPELKGCGPPDVTTCPTTSTVDPTGPSFETEKVNLLPFPTA